VWKIFGDTLHCGVELNSEWNWCISFILSSVLPYSALCHQKSSTQMHNYSVYQTYTHTTSATHKIPHSECYTVIMKFNTIRINEDWLPYTRSTWPTPATLWPRTLLPHTGDHTTHISAHNSTSEGTPYHSNIENHTAPFKTVAESHLGAPFHNTISMFITATAQSPVLHHIGANTETAFVLLITTSQT